MGFCNFVLHVVFFQEHDIGVWVSRAIPSGNGAKQGVQYGDQLAAINGRSSVHTTIDEVAVPIDSSSALGATATTKLGTRSNGWRRLVSKEKRTSLKSESESTLNPELG